MKRIVFLVALLAVVAVAAGCRSPSGSRQFVPGKGWVPTR